MADYILEQVEQTYSDLNGLSVAAGDWPPDAEGPVGSWTFAEGGRYNFDFDQASAAYIASIPGIIGWRIDIHMQSGPVEGQTVRLYWNLSVIDVVDEVANNFIWGPSDDSPGSYFDFAAPDGQDYTQLITPELQYVGPPIGPYEFLAWVVSAEPGDAIGHLVGSALNDPIGETGSVTLSKFDVVFFTEDYAIRKTARRDGRGWQSANRVGGNHQPERIGGHHP